MCGNIKNLFNYDPPATDQEIRAASVQFVRKLSGSTGPSKPNEAAFEHAVDAITKMTRELLDSLIASAPPKIRLAEATKAQSRTPGRLS